MPNTPKKFRPSVLLHPYDHPGDDDLANAQQNLNDDARSLEQIKLEVASILASQGSYGDTLVANPAGVFVPQRFVPLTFGVGTSGNTRYQFQVSDGPIDTRFTDIASGGVVGWFVNGPASGGVRTGVTFMSGGTALWEFGVDGGGNAAIRNSKSGQNALQINSALTVLVSGSSTILGTLMASGNLQVGGSGFVAGDLSVGGTFTPGNLAITNLRAPGTVLLGATTANSLGVTGATSLLTLIAGPTTLNSLAVTGNTGLSGSLTVVGVLAASGGLSAQGDFWHNGSKFGARGSTPVVKPTSYTITNDSDNRTLNVSTVTLTQLANLVASLLKDLNSQGIEGTQ